MNEYIVILDIVFEVLNGKNLNKIFNSKINKDLNISRVKDICYGIFRNYYILKNIIDKLVTKKSDQKIECLLLIGLYEFKFTKKPHFAITNEIVELSFKIYKNQKIKNFINAVLRNYLRNSLEVENSLLSNNEYVLNFPNVIANKLKNDYPNDYQNIIINLNKKPKLGLRVNTNKISITDYLKILESNNLEYKLIDNKIVLNDYIAINEIPLFKDGLVSIQDIGAQKITELINLNLINNALDACSAPGGKLCQILELKNNINIVGLDIDQDRLNKVRENLERLKLKAKLLVGDASNCNWWDGNLFDLVIADVPCSASGTIKRNPDIKIHRQLNDIESFVTTQMEIIINLWKTLNVGGILVYITCSIFKEENKENIKYLTKKLNNVKIVNELILLPTEYSDGFYYCILEKVSNAVT